MKEKQYGYGDDAFLQAQDINKVFPAYSELPLDLRITTAITTMRRLSEFIGYNLDYMRQLYLRAVIILYRQHKPTDIFEASILASYITRIFANN